MKETEVFVEQRQQAANDLALAHANGHITWFEALEAYAAWLAIAEEASSYDCR